MEEAIRPPGHEFASAQRRRRAIFGMMLVAAGVLLFLHEVGLLEGFPLWALFIVGLGIVKTIGACCQRQVRSGLWVLGIGLWLAVNGATTLRYRDTWPLLLLMGGVLIVWQGLWPGQPCAICSEGRHDR